MDWSEIKTFDRHPITAQPVYPSEERVAAALALLKRFEAVGYEHTFGHYTIEGLERIEEAFAHQAACSLHDGRNCKWFRFKQWLSKLLA